MADVRIRSNSELVDAAFEIYRRHFSVFLTLAVLAFLPSIPMVISTPPGATPKLGLVALLFIPLAIVFSCLGAAAVIIAASNAYLGNGPVEVENAILKALERPWQVILAYIIKGILTIIGFILFIVPGFIALKSFFAVPATIVLEKLDAGAGLKRSRALSIGTTKRIFLVLGLSWLFYLVAVTLLGGVTQLLFGQTIWTSFINLALYALLYPMIEIITTLLYYDIRIRSEGYDIELMAKNLDADLAS